jgi:hypothetical protein
MIFRVDDQVGNGARRQSFQPYPTSTTPPCGGVGWASSPSVPLGTTWLRRDAYRLGVTSGRAETGARRIGKGAAAKSAIVADQLGSVRDVGSGEPVTLLVQVTEAFSSPVQLTAASLALADLIIQQRGWSVCRRGHRRAGVMDRPSTTAGTFRSKPIFPRGISGLAK